MRYFPDSIFVRTATIFKLFEQIDVPDERSYECRQAPLKISMPMHTAHWLEIIVPYRLIFIFIYMYIDWIIQCFSVYLSIVPFSPHSLFFFWCVSIDFIVFVLNANSLSYDCLVCALLGQHFCFSLLLFYCLSV